MAVRRDRASGALRAHGRASRLAERHEVAVPGLPVFHGERGAKGHLGLDWLFRVDHAEPVAYPVDVYVDTDRGEREPDGDRQVGCLAPDARKFAQLLDGLWHDAAELLAQRGREGLQMPGLVVVESDGVDELFDFLYGESLKVGGGKCISLRGREETFHSPGGAGVLRPRGKYCADEDAEGVLSLRLD